MCGGGDRIEEGEKEGFEKEETRQSGSWVRKR